MHKRIFTLFVLMLFLTPSVAFAQESVPDSGGGETTPDSGSSGDGSSTSSDGGSGTSDSGSSSSGEGSIDPSGGSGGGEGSIDSGEPRDFDSSQPSIANQESSEQRTCPKDMCMKGKDCVPCPSSENTRFEVCPSTPPNKCAPDQAVKAIFDNRGCVIDHECGPSGSGRPRFDNVPQGCHIEKGEFGDFVKCDQKESEFKDMEAKCRSQGGRFNNGKRGPECLFDNQNGGGFFGAPNCPGEEELKKQIDYCNSNGGNPEKFIDRIGCKIVSCSYSSGEGNFEDLKADPRECESRGGKFVIIKDEPRCFTNDDQVRIKENLDEIEPTDLLKIALRLENILKSLEEIGDNFEDLKNFYEKRGDTEKAASFERALAKIDGAAARLDEIKFGLAEKAGDITEEDRHQVIRDIQDIKNIMQDIAVDILSGGRSSRSERRSGGEFDDEFEDDFDDEGIDFMNAIRQCEDYSENDPYSFNPEKDVSVELRGLKDGKCVMVIAPPGGVGGVESVEFLLPPKTYQFFDGPHLLLNSDVDCSPEDACAMMRRFIESEDQGKRPRERFGEKERMEPRECKEAGATGEKCFDLMFVKIGPPPECRGLSLQECKEKTFRQPEERRDEFRGEEFDQGEFRDEFRGDGEFGQPLRSTRDGQDFRGQPGPIPPECIGLSPDECKKLFMGGEGPEGNFELRDFGNPDDFGGPIPSGDFRDFEPEDFEGSDDFKESGDLGSFVTTQPTESTEGAR